MLTMLGTLVALLLACAVPAAAAVIYDNGGMPTDNGFESDFDTFHSVARFAADDFILAQDNTITDVHWTGGYFFANTPLASDSFTISICQNASGVPGTCTPLVVTSLVRTPLASGYAYSAQVAPITLPPGVVHWLSIVNNTSADTDDNWFWAGKDGAGNAVLQHDGDDPTDTWHRGSLALDFRLTGGGNHFKCYSVEGENLNQTVNLVDQFGNVTTSVRVPKLLCNPADKNGEGIPNPLAHLVCYTIKDLTHPPQTPDVLVNNQFGEAQLDVIKSQLLCVPSTKLECPTNQVIDISTGQTDPVWQLTSAPSGTLGGFPHPAIPISPNGSWLTFPGTSWVSANTSCKKTVTPDCPRGLYSYELCWQQCGPVTASLQLHADNNATVFLGSTPIGTTPPNGFQTTTTITVPDPGPSERNCLRIDVTNFPSSGGGGTATGIDVKGTLSGAVIIVP